MSCVSRTSIVISSDPLSLFPSLPIERVVSWSIRIDWISLLTDHSLSIKQSIFLSLSIDRSFVYHSIYHSNVPLLFVNRRNRLNLSFNWSRLSMDLIDWISLSTDLPLYRLIECVCCLCCLDRSLGLSLSIDTIYVVVLFSWQLLGVSSIDPLSSRFILRSFVCIRAQAPCTKVTGWLSTYEGKREQF
jgi:hypothetical protein